MYASFRSVTAKSGATMTPTLARIFFPTSLDQEFIVLMQIITLEVLQKHYHYRNSLETGYVLKGHRYFRYNVIFIRTEKFRPLLCLTYCFLRYSLSQIYWKRSKTHNDWSWESVWEDVGARGRGMTPSCVAYDRRFHAIAAWGTWGSEKGGKTPI